MQDEHEEETFIEENRNRTSSEGERHRKRTGKDN